MRSFFVFGGDGAGGGYFVDPRQDDPEIHYWDHEDDHTVALGVTLSQYRNLPECQIGDDG